MAQSCASSRPESPLRNSEDYTRWWHVPLAVSRSVLPREINGERSRPPFSLADKCGKAAELPAERRPQAGPGHGQEILPAQLARACGQGACQRLPGDDFEVAEINPFG